MKSAMGSINTYLLIRCDGNSHCSTRRRRRGRRKNPNCFFFFLQSKDYFTASYQSVAAPQAQNMTALTQKPIFINRLFSPLSDIAILSSPIYSHYRWFRRTGSRQSAQFAYMQINAYFILYYIILKRELKLGFQIRLAFPIVH